MGRTLFKIRIGIVLAVAIASLAFTSSAFAKPVAQDIGGSAVNPPALVVSTSSGFNWGDALVGAGVAFGIAALGGSGIAYVARNRTRLA